MNPEYSASLGGISMVGGFKTPWTVNYDEMEIRFNSDSISFFRSDCISLHPFCFLSGLATLLYQIIGARCPVSPRVACSPVEHAFDLAAIDVA